MHSHLVSDRIYVTPAGLRLSSVAWRRTFVLSLAAGARMVEERDGYPPAKLAIGGLIVWALFLAMMTVGANALPMLG